MAAAVENDIEEFIRNQKAKLQQERQYLSHQTGGLQQQSPRKPDLDYNEIERKFQEQKRREFNDYVNRPKFKKAPTPPQSGMKFGEYEDFRKRVEQQRKEEYRSELEKQTLEQAMIRAQGDIPRIGTKPNISQEELNNIAQEKQRRDLRDKMVEDKRIREFERMLHMSHHDDRLTDYMEQERNRIIEDYPLREQDILAMFQRQIEEKERRKQNEARERELEKKQLEFERKLDQNYLQDRNDLGFQGRNAARSEPPPPGRRGDQYDAPRQQSEYVPPRRGARSPPRQDYSPRQEEREGFTERLHKRYEDERRQDYQNHVQQSESDPPFSHRLGGYETHRNKLKTQRILETQQHMEERNAQATNRSWNEPEDTESGLPLGNDFNHKQQMEVQRNREYNEFLKKKYDKNRAPAGKQRGGTLSLGQYEDEKKKLQQERQREYRELMDKKEQERNRGRRGEPTRSKSPDNFFSGFGKHDEERNKLNVERKKEYNHMLAEDLPRRGRPRDPPQEREDTPPREPEIYEASLHGLRQHDSAEVRKKQTRNDEYNDFLKQNREKEKHKYDKQKYGESRRRGGNRPPPGPRRGWQSPGNDDGGRRRREEPSYRQDDRDRRLKSYNSDGAINRAGNDRRYDDDDDDDRRGRYRSDRNRDKGILDDDNWLSARQEPEDEYQNLEPNPPRQRGRAPPNRSPPPDKEDMARANYFATLPVGVRSGGNDRESANARKKARYREELQLQMREAEAARRREKEREKVEELRVNASGLLDPEKTPKRLTYLGEPNPSPRRNLKSPEVRPYHTRFDLSPRGQGIEPESSGGYTPRERGRTRERRPRERSGGILDIGFDGLLDQPRRGGASQVPPGLQYQPSFADPNIERTRTYVTGGGSGGLNQPYSSIDEAYHYYGMKNPLEPDNSAPPPLDLGGGGGGYDRPYRGSPRVTFDDSSKKYGILKDERYEKKDEIVQTFDQKDETVQTIEITVPPPPTTARARDRSKERISPYQFPSDDDLRSRSQNDKRSYQEELDRQIQEKRYRKQREKEEQERYEKKLDDEIRNYNPFGKGGGGAPLRDNQGNIVADLRAMHQDPETARSTARATHESPRFRAPSSPRDDLIAPPPDQIDASGDVTHARGGHGIFGQPKTEQEKTQSDRYKDELRRQIEEKKRREQIEKEKERIEEEKENRRLEEQRLRIQKEYEEEQRKKREKEEETRRRNEELQQQAEAKKKEAKRKRQEEDERRTQEKRDQQERERQERQEPRGSSPPVPAVRTATEQKPDYAEDKKTPEPTISPKPGTSEDTRKSPPIPALRREPSPLVESSRPPPQPPSRANSSDVLKELASMRKQLQSERKRVENALETQRNEPDVFDPRMVQRPAPKEIDVFERARQGEPAPVRTENLNPRNIQEFNELKYKNDTESRKAFRSMFPDAPTSSETLEAQQDALLRHQEDTLKSMKETMIDKKAKDRDLFSGLGAPPLTTRQGTVSPRSMLNSNSAFIDVDGLNHFPDDFEDLPKRNESARYRRRERVTLSPRPESQPLNPFGSTASLDVDRIQRKNDARLRRLHQLNADEVSLADPDDILDRFMAKQRYNRPPSGQTLQDDTWLRPASKAI